VNRHLVWIAAAAALWSSPAAAADTGGQEAGAAVAACIAASEKGQSERDAGHYRNARKAFGECARDDCPAVVAKQCAGWLRQLDETAPTLVLGARDEQGHDIDDVAVSFDGEPFVSKLDGRPIEVDGGPHVLRFERPGSEPVEEHVVLRAGEKARVLTVTLRSTTVATPPGTAEPETAEPEPVTPPPEPEPMLSARHVTAAALVLGALGAAGTGVFFLTQASSESQSASQLRGALPTNACVGGSSSLCSNLSQTVSQQHTDENVATSLFVGSGILLAGAVAAWALWPSHDAPQTSGLAPVPGGAVLFFSARLP
jgi:hypothetical protein